MVELLPVAPPTLRYIFWHLAASLNIAYFCCPLRSATWGSRSVCVDAHEVLERVRAALDHVRGVRQQLLLD